MHLTNILHKSAKTKVVMVLMRSTGSSHSLRSFRLKNDDKKEFIRYDPYVQMECVYKEEKKLHSMKRPINISKQSNEDTYGIIPKELLAYDVPPKEKKSKIKEPIKNK